MVSTRYVYVHTLCTHTLCTHTLRTHCVPTVPSPCSMYLLHTYYGEGVLSMANTGKDTNRAQFFLLFRPQPHLDGKHVVFGRVVGGLSTLDAVEAVGSTSGSTSLPVDITACTVA